MITINDLERVGLKGKSAAVYLALLQLGTATAYELSAATGIKRPTTYDVLAELSSKNLVSMNTSGSKRQYTARDPENLKQIPEEQLFSIGNMLPELKALYNRGTRKPRIRYFEGTDGLKRIHEELLQVHSGEYFYFDAGMKMVDLLGAVYLKRFVQRRMKKGIWSYSIRAKEAEVDVPFLKSGDEYLRSIRFFPAPVHPNFTSIYIFDRNVGIAASREEEYAMIIESLELCRSVKTLWDFIWEISVPAD